MKTLTPNVPIYTYQFQQWRFESVRRLVATERDVRLSPNEAGLLAKLLNGVVLNHETSRGDVLRLRKKLGDQMTDGIILTIRSEGYRLNVEGVQERVSERLPKTTDAVDVNGVSPFRQPRFILSFVEHEDSLDTVDRVLKQHYPRVKLIQRTATAKNIWITGLNLSRIGEERLDAIRSLLARNVEASVKILMLSPRCEAIRYGVQQDYGCSGDIDAYRKSVRDAFGRFRVLRMDYPKQVELRTVDFPLTFGMDAIDPDAADGSIHVLFYPVHSGEGDKPLIALHPSNATWYPFYLKQLEIQWADFGARHYLRSNVRVDRAAPNDIPGIVALATKLAPHRSRSKAAGFLRPYSESEYKHFANTTPYFFVLHRGSELVGFLLAHTNEGLEEYRGSAYDGLARVYPRTPILVVRQIAIAEAYRGLDIARDAYDYLFTDSDLDTKVHKKAVCVIWSHNEASQRFHRKCGWAREANPSWSPRGGELWCRDL